MYSNVQTLIETNHFERWLLTSQSAHIASLTLASFAVEAAPNINTASFHGISLLGIASDVDCDALRI